jgi:transposase InsO family protein
MNAHRLHEWVQRFKDGGPEALRPRHGGPPKKPQDAPDPRRDAVTALKREHPEHGTRRIRDLLARFEGLGVSETTVRRILHEAGLLQERPAELDKAPRPETRFERAAPNQMWQSDIFTFLLRRHERLYLTAFMDDHSRFLVSHVLAHHQRSSLVMEALARGIACYGVPQEVLTDQGRQYTAWRGQTEFEDELRRQGIRHVKSRPHHPQTLGKIERFWKTLWEEFLSRTVFADFSDCERRLSLFVQAYNFQRPHQGLAGLTPADRFFQAAPQVRTAIESTVAANALRLALEQPPRKPFYLVGRLGDRDLRISAAGAALEVQVGNEQPQKIELPKENDDDRQEALPRRYQEAGLAAQAPRTTDAEMVVDAAGAGRCGAAALPDDPVGAVGREAGDGGDHRRWDLARDLLPARGESVEGDAVGTDAGRRGGGRGWPGGEPRAADRAAGDAGREAGEGEASSGAAAAADAEGGEAGAVEGGHGATGEEEGRPELDGEWRDAFAEAELGDDVVESFDADADVRDRALRWERKLAGESAPGEARAIRREHEPEEADELRASAGSAGSVAGPLSGDAGGAVGSAHSERWSAEARGVAQSFPDADASGVEGSAGGAGAEPAGAASEAGAGDGAGDTERAAEKVERAPAGAGGHDRPAVGCGEPDGAGSGEAEAAEGVGGTGSER